MKWFFLISIQEHCISIEEHNSLILSKNAMHATAFGANLYSQVSFCTLHSLAKNTVVVTMGEKLFFLYNLTDFASVISKVLTKFVTERHWH